MSPETDELVADLGSLLHEWLPRQSWFDAGAQEVDGVAVLGVETLRREWPVVLWAPVDVTVDGEPTLCQVVVALAEVVPDPVPEIGIIGEVRSGSTAVMAYDAFADPAAASAFVDHTTDGLAPTGVVAVEHHPWRTVLTLAGNWELTVHRRVEGGAHPDAELTAVVADSGLTTVRPPAAVWRRNQADLAIARRNARHTGRADRLVADSALEVLRRRCRPRENPLDVADQLTEIGASLARLHVALADRLGTFAATGSELAEVMAARLPRHLDDAAGERVVAAYRRLDAADDLGRFIRVHANLGFAAVDRVRNGWVFTRFGGDPNSQLTLDRAPMSPLWDVSGLLFELTSVAADAVAAAVAGRWGDGQPDESDQREQEQRRELVVLAEAWEERGADAIVSGYTSVDEVHRLLPVERISRDALLTVFELERSVAAAARLVAAGPDLLRLPLEAVEEILDAGRPRRW